jgi:hypothetical protein
MRIALVLYGRIKHFETFHANLKRVFGADTEIDTFLSHSPELNEPLDDFISLFNPIAVQNDPILFDQEYLKYPTPNPDVNVRNMFSHFTNKHRVFQLLEDYIEKTGTTYTYIVCTRLDLNIFDTLQIKISPNTIYIPIAHQENGDKHIGDGYDWSGINDQFALGDFFTMKKYCSLILYYKDLVRKNVKHHPESLLLGLLYNYSIHILRFPLRYVILRK